MTPHPPPGRTVPLWRTRSVLFSALAGLTLILFVGASAQRMLVAARQLAGGQGDLLFNTVADEIHTTDHRPTVAQLNRIVADYSDIGLASVHITWPDGPTASDAPGPHDDAQKRIVRPLPPPRDGSRRQRPPPPRGHEGPPDRGGPGGPPPPGGDFPMLTITYVATAAATATTQALFQLLLALIAACFITALGVRFAQGEQRRAGLTKALGEQRLLASLGEMSAVLAHEIRNPLGALKGHAQLLVEDLEEAGVDVARAERLVRESTRLEDIVNVLLTFVHSGELSRRETELTPLIRDAVRRVPEANVEVTFGKDAPPTASVDGGRLCLAFENLVRNAAAAGTGRVQVEVLEDRGGWSLTVEDDGRGVPAEIKERIFEPFVTGKTKGTGLGLALSRRIVEAHKGTLTLGEPRGLGGAVFVMTLPRSDSKE